MGTCGRAGPAARAGGARHWGPGCPEAFQCGSRAGSRRGLGGGGSRETGSRGCVAAAPDQLWVGSLGVPRVGHGRCPAGGELEGRQGEGERPTGRRIFIT